MFVYVRFSVCPRDWPGTHKGFQGLCEWHRDTCLLPYLKEKGWGIPLAGETIVSVPQGCSAPQPRLQIHRVQVIVLESL